MNSNSNNYNTRVLSGITTGNLSEIPVSQTNYIEGSTHNYINVKQMLEIFQPLRRVGMFCFVAERGPRNEPNNNYYQLQGPLPQDYEYIGSGVEPATLPDDYVTNIDYKIKNDAVFGTRVGPSNPIDYYHETLTLYEKSQGKTPTDPQKVNSDDGSIAGADIILTENEIKLLDSEEVYTLPKFINNFTNTSAQAKIPYIWLSLTLTDNRYLDLLSLDGALPGKSTLQELIKVDGVWGVLVRIFGSLSQGDVINKVEILRPLGDNIYFLDDKPIIPKQKQNNKKYSLLFSEDKWNYVEVVDI
eukprot:Pgem_evm5s9439